MKSDDQVVKMVVHSGGELFEVETCNPPVSREGLAPMPAIFNLKFRYNSKDQAALAGGGIYAIYYDGELLYIGIFTGDRGVPFASNVAAQRYWKHLEALTMRGYSVGFNPTNYDKSIQLPDGHLVSALRASTEPRGRGAVRSYPCKVEFAARRWNAMSKVEKDASVLGRFTFIYGRVGPDHFQSDVSYGELKRYLEAIEAGLILDYRPICNVKFPRINREDLKIGSDEQAWDEFRVLIDEQVRPAVQITT